MSEEPIPSSEPEISPPPLAGAPPRPPRPDPEVIDGEATEIADRPASAANAPEAAGQADPSPAKPARPGYVLPAAAGFGGAILGGALALVAVWLIEPRAGATDQAPARLAALESSTQRQSAAVAELDKRAAALEAGEVNWNTLDALGRRVAALEASAADAKTALDEARAARADAAKALAATPAPPSPGAASSEDEARLAKLETELASAEAKLDDRLGKLEGASAAPKSDARVAPSPGGASGGPVAVAVLAQSLDRRFAAGAPYAPELAGLARLGVADAALAPLKPFADSGAPNVAALAAAWDKIEPAVAAAAPVADRSGWDRLIDHMRGLVRVHRVGEAAVGDDTAPPVAQVGAALSRGDVTAALAAFERLPEASRAAGRSWFDGAKARDAAAKAAAALSAEAIGRLAAAKD